MAARTCSRPLPSERHGPGTQLLRSLLPKLTFCFGAAQDSSPLKRSREEQGKQKADVPAPTYEGAVRRLRQRQEFEDLVGRPLVEYGAWVRYALWEESHGDPPRARDVWERAVAATGEGDPDVWAGYAEFEARRGGAAGARVVWERALAVARPSDRVWCEYARMEEDLGSYAGARQVFERWMERRLGPWGWLAYADFELRNGEVRRARAVYERLVRRHAADAAAWARFVEFEARHGGVERTRACYERAVEAVVGEDRGESAAKLVAAFAEFEERCRKPECARRIYRYGLERLRDGAAEGLRREYQEFERRRG
ncbi:hypothetical protein Taro_040338 [Colocasia esculenta]|uniref:Uncharacterized protein n=1 Tax=Colocasia esculenta TaxID=4460 RepID=A0A843WIT1_COLES|nr:hypothetical protein [Colocasia esculenta]